MRIRIPGISYAKIRGNPELRGCYHMKKEGLNGTTAYYCLENRCVNNPLNGKRKCEYAYNGEFPENVYTTEDGHKFIKCKAKEVLDPRQPGKTEYISSKQ